MGSRTRARSGDFPADDEPLRRRGGLPPTTSRPLAVEGGGCDRTDSEAAPASSSQGVGHEFKDDGHRPWHDPPSWLYLPHLAQERDREGNRDVHMDTGEMRPRRRQRGKRPRSPSALAPAMRQRPSPSESERMPPLGSSGQQGAGSVMGAADTGARTMDLGEGDPYPGVGQHLVADVGTHTTASEAAAQSDVSGETEGRAEHSRSRSPPLSGPAPTRPQARAVGPRRVSHFADPVDAVDAEGHTLVITGPMIWCARCGRHAVRRLGRALKSQCRGRAEGVYASRLARLRQVLHPITGVSIIP